MIDLSLQNKRKFYNLKWLDGSVVNLKAPTQRLYKAVQQFQENEDVDSIYYITQEILNTNVLKKNYDASELSIDLCTMVLQDYFEFWGKELEQVVFQQSQQTNQ